MTLAPLAHDFPLATLPIERPGLPPLILSRRDISQIDEAERAAALADELDHRVAAYPRLVKAGKLAQDAADRHVALWRELVEDPARDHPNPVPRWDAKVRELRRELALRRRVYPKRIAGGADPLRLRRAMEAIEAVHWHYWLNGDYWDALPPSTLAIGWHCPYAHTDDGRAIGHWPCARAAAREARMDVLRAHNAAADEAKAAYHAARAAAPLEQAA